MTILIANIFFLLLTRDVMLGLSVPTRAYVGAEIEAGRIMQPVPDVARAIAYRQMPLHLQIVILGLGLFVTVCSWGGSSSPERRSR